MRWVIPLVLLLCAFTPLYPRHDTTQKIDQEFSNVENDLQSQQFTIWKTTPNLNDLKDGQLVIVVTTTTNSMVFRQNNQLYAVNFSCMTVK